MGAPAPIDAGALACSQSARSAASPHFAPVHHTAIPGIGLRAKVKPSSARNKMAVERHDRVEHMSHSCRCVRAGPGGRTICNISCS